MQEKIHKNRKQPSNMELIEKEVIYILKETSTS